jgi:predicted DNA binding CopG/RHH family protein
MSKKNLLDDYEQDIENFVEKSVVVKGLQQELALIQSAAKQHLTRKKSITIRVHEMDLEAIKMIASKNGVPYQTYLNIIIHREASHFLR